MLIADFNKEESTRVVEFLADHRCAGRVVFANVTKRADWDRICCGRLEKFSRLDNSAGMAYQVQSSLTVLKVSFNMVFSVDVKSIFHSA